MSGILGGCKIFKTHSIFVCFVGKICRKEAYAVFDYHVFECKRQIFQELNKARVNEPTLYYCIYMTSGICPENLELEASTIPG